ncbi:hypothetical protein ACFOW1_01005 [Parasediminibacterium paludis]|uniref:YcxB-like protein n=1 Tax=Parasediminibacterium paludis TaxID=908966 RepID=A0ABV8PS96_9BACT
MESVQIDIEKSIRSNKLKMIHVGFDQMLGQVFYLLFSVFVISLGIIFPVFLKLKAINEGGEKFRMPWIIWLPVFLISLLTLYALANYNRLERFHGSDRNANRRLIVEILEKRFNVQLPAPEGQIFRFYKRASLWKWGTRVIIIFDNDDLLINISRFNDRGLKSPFHPFFDNFTVKSIFKTLAAEISNTA